MAVLEAFVYDPLLNRRLIDNANCTKAAKRTKTAGNATQAEISVSPLKNRQASDTAEVSLRNTAASTTQMASSLMKAHELGMCSGYLSKKPPV